MRKWLWGLATVLLVGGQALAEPRIALVVGNGNYDTKIGALANPVNDAKSVSAALRKAGFDVDVQVNLDQKGLKRAISKLGERLRTAGSGATGLFYYGGHGMQAKGENFLVPIGAAISSEADIEIEAVQASNVLSQMEEAGNNVNIVILDACRNTPGVHKTRGSATRGLARMDAPKGSFIAYSTAPGEVAEDGAGGHSPFAEALVDQLKTPAPIDKMFIDVRRRVLAATGQHQTPWTSSSLVNEFYFIPPTTAKSSGVAGTPVQAADNRTLELEFWKSVADSNDTDQLQDYVSRYPNGTFVNIAKAKIAALKKHPTPIHVAAVDPSNRNIATNVNAVEELRKTLNMANMAETKARDLASQARSEYAQKDKESDAATRKALQTDLLGGLIGAAISAAAKNVTDGVGVKTLKNGEKYAGDLRGGLPEGFGVVSGSRTSPYREAAGQFSNGVLNGYATATLSDGSTLKGYWENGKLSRYGAKFDFGGNLIEQGYYNDGVLETTVQ